MDDRRSSRPSHAGGANVPFDWAESSSPATRLYVRRKSASEIFMAAAVADGQSVWSPQSEEEVSQPASSSLE